MKVREYLEKIQKKWRRIYENCFEGCPVSVIVPVYNDEETIKSCLDSLLAQTKKPKKIICVNDGSTDNTDMVLKEYRKFGRRIKVVNQKNSGRSAARNTGLRLTRTKYVMFCDGDDLYKKDMCEKMLSSIRESEADLAVCGIELVYKAHEDMGKSDEEYYRLKYNGAQQIDDEIIMNTDASICNKIFRTKMINQYNIEFPVGLNNEDYYFCNAYLSMSNTIYYLNRKLYKYIRRSGSIMSDNFEGKKKSIDHLLVAEKLFFFYKRNEYLNEHIDLFWKQWIESFWASYRYSSKKYYWELKEIADSFLRKNYEKYKPVDSGVIKCKDDIVKVLKNIRKEA